MKKVIFMLCCIGFLVVSGCGEDQLTPKDFGKNYAEKKFNGMGFDLEDLEYTVTEEGDDKAVVEIKGDIQYEEKISLVKQEGKWLLASEAASPEKIESAVKVAPESKVQH